MKSEIVLSDQERLYHLGVATDEIAPNLLLVGDPARADRVAAHFDRVDHLVTHREFRTLTGVCQGIPISVIGTGIGTDNVEIAVIEAWAALTLDLETLVRRDDAPKIRAIRVGTSGGAAPDLLPGSLCIAEYALGLDATGPYYEVPIPDAICRELENQAHTELLREVPGTSRKAPEQRRRREVPGTSRRFRGSFAPYGSKASPEVVAALERNCRSRQNATDKVAWETGITVTSPGFYGASSRYIEGLVNTVPDIKGALARIEVDGRRVLNFEMESSLLFHLAAGLGIDAGTVCVSISSPSRAETLIDYDTRIEAAIDVGLGALIDLVEGSDSADSPEH